MIQELLSVLGSSNKAKRLALSILDALTSTNGRCSEAIDADILLCQKALCMVEAEEVRDIHKSTTAELHGPATGRASP